MAPLAPPFPPPMAIPSKCKDGAMILEFYAAKMLCYTLYPHMYIHTYAYVRIIIYICSLSNYTYTYYTYTMSVHIYVTRSDKVGLIAEKHTFISGIHIQFDL